MWVQCVCLLLAAGVTAIAADPTYLSDLAILEQAIASSAVKVAAAESTSVGLLSSAQLLSDQASGIIPFEQGIESAVSALLTDLVNFVEIPAFIMKERVQNLRHAVASSRSKADSNRARHRALSEELAKLQDDNSVQSGQLTKLSAFLTLVMSSQNEVQAEKLTLLSSINTNLMSVASFAVTQIEHTKCFVGEVVVNVTSGEGRETLSYPSSFFIPLVADPVPTTYCAISGLVSNIDEEQPAVGYRHVASSREQTGFSVGCTSTESEAEVVVLDRSRSEKALNKFTEVTVQIKACNFAGVGLNATSA